MNTRKIDQTLENSQAQEHPRVPSVLRNALDRRSFCKLSTYSKSLKEEVIQGTRLNNGTIKTQTAPLNAKTAYLSPQIPEPPARAVVDRSE